jgi:hypothetical protein
MISNPVLWDRIEKYRIDDLESNLKFSDRLRRENGWSNDFTARVIDEYKCFLYLACVAGHEITPSEEVDQVWHLHLVYSHSYWSDLCGEVLQRPLHHGPTKGGKIENDRYAENYEATLASYEREFESRPPSDIWPNLKTRFQNPGRLKIVDTDRNWVIRKPTDFTPLKLIAAIGFIAFVPACVTASSSNAGEKSSASKWLLGIVLFIFGFQFLRWLVMPRNKEEEDAKKRTSNKDGSSGCGSASSGCSGGGCGGGCS